MKLTKLKYKQFENDPRYWYLKSVDFGNINLIVGKNSAGKSKTINVIHGLSNLISQNSKLPYRDGDYSVCFEENSNVYELELIYKNRVIEREYLKINDKLILEREKSGNGKMFNQAIDGYENFKMPIDEFKLNRRDELRYPFLEMLNFWANHLRLFSFSGHLGKSMLGLKDTKNPFNHDYDLKDTNKVVDTFSRGVKKYGDKFTNKIIEDFNSIGYSIEKIELGGMISFELELIDNPNLQVVGIRVKEKDIEGMTDQGDMSMGMFRALSLIISFNFYEFENIPGTILIDDIGEGLDYERSTELIKLLIRKAELNSSIQLIMTTNDRFVMNSVDLKYWELIDRIGGNVEYFTISNSKEKFDEFKFTGLNNFDFFSSEFFKKNLDNDSE